MPAPEKTERQDETTSRELFNRLSWEYKLVPWQASSTGEGIPGAYLMAEKYTPKDEGRLIEELRRGLLLRPIMRRIQDEVSWETSLGNEPLVALLQRHLLHLHEVLGRNECAPFVMLRGLG